MNILMCIGNSERGDDGMSHYVATHFKHPDWTVLDCGTVPENFTGVVKKAKPDRAVLLDVADMDLAPGQIRSIPRDRIRHVSVGTHSIPLYLLMDYLGESTPEVLFVGIQPTTLDYGDTLSAIVKKAAGELVKILKTGHLDEIEILKEEAPAG
jgi:hydrogenase 3 maturation protease